MVGATDAASAQSKQWLNELESNNIDKPVRDFIVNSGFKTSNIFLRAIPSEEKAGKFADTS